MNKKILFAAIITATVCVSGWNISRNKSEPTLSDMALENVEALADENGQYYTNRDDEYDSVNHCYRQCVKDGNSCYYMNNFSYSC